MAGITVTPFFVLKQLGGTEQTSGVFGAVQAAAYASLALLSAGFVSRAKNGLTIAAGGILFYALFYASMPLFRDWRVILAVSTVAYAALALVWPALHSWVGAEPDPQQRARTMSWFNIAWSFGFSLSPLLAGPLYDLNFHYPFIALAVIAGIAFALVRSLPHESAHFTEPTEELLMARAEHDKASESFLWAGWCATFIANLLAGGIRFIYPKRIDDLIQSGELRIVGDIAPAEYLISAPATNYSFLAFSFSISTALMFLMLGRTTWWQHRFSFLVGMQAASAVAIYILGRTHSLVIMGACSSVIGAFLGLAFFSATYYSLSNPARKHGRAAINEAAVGFGGFFGSLACGYVAQHYGIVTPYLYAPMLIAIAIALQIVLLRLASRRGAATR